MNTGYYPLISFNKLRRVSIVLKDNSVLPTAISNAKTKLLNNLLGGNMLAMSLGLRMDPGIGKQARDKK